jgi:hypothetical protein
VWHRREEAASAGLSAAPYSAHHKLYSETVVSSVASAVALAEVGRFRETVQYLQKAAKALYEAAKEVFERVKVAAQRLVELFVESVARVLAWVDVHKAYLFLMAAVAAGVVALAAVLDMWGLVELEKLAYAASLTPFFAGRTKTGGKAAERFRSLAEWYERWKIDANVIDEIISAPLKGERPYAAFLKLAAGRGLPPPLVVLRRALARVKGKAKRDAVVAAALVLYKTLVKNAEAYREWAELYRWARSLVEKQEFTVATSDIKRLREAHRRLEEVAEQVRRELNSVLTLYSKSDLYKEKPDFLDRLKFLLEVDVKKAEGLAEAGYKRLSDYSDANMGTKAYATLLSIARGGTYGHVAMLLMGEGALADVVLLTPRSAYEKAYRIANTRGETVDPSYSGRRGRSVGKPSWEDRAASVLLRYLLGRAVNEDLMFRRIGEGFEVFRAYGNVEALVDVLKIGETAARSKAGEEVLRHFVEEAKREAPDLLGLDKAPQYLEWRTTDVTTFGGRIEAATAHPWQLRWYFSLLGDEQSFSGNASVTKEGIKPVVTVYWSRERENQILRESRWLESLLGRRVESWRELVDAIDWRWVLKKVEELVDKLKPWIGPERAGDAEREGLVKRMLGELALLVHFAEARRGKDDSDWREERIKMLAKAVEDLSGGRIAGDHAERLARAIIRYAEGYKKEAEERIENLVKDVSVSREEVWGVVERVLSGEDPYVYCLARDCAGDAVVRKFVAPALELIMLEKARNNEFDREEARLIFGEMYATALAGDGTVGPGEVTLVVGGELGGGAALLRLATLHLLNQLLSEELKFKVRVYVGESRNYDVTATGEDAARFKRFLAVSAPSAGGEYLSEKFDKFVEEARVEVRPGDLRRTDGGNVAADLIISEGDIKIKYNVYLRGDAIVLQFASTDRSRAELAVRLLKLAGVTAEVKKEGGRDVWRIEATIDRLAAGLKELREAIAEIVRRAGVDEKKAERWLEKLETGRTVWEDRPKYYMGLARSGALDIRYRSTSRKNIEREARWLENMGLEEGKHFTVKMPEGGKAGYVSLLKEGLAHAAWLSVYGTEGQRDLAAEFVKYILKRAEEEGKEVSEKAQKIIEEGKTRASLKLEDFEKKVEVNGRMHVVKVISGGAEFDKGRSGKKLLRIRITAEVDGVRSDYTITFGRYRRDNAAMGYATAKADDAERFSALIKALTGKEPWVYQRSDGKIEIVCGREHLEGFKRYAELADAIEKWLEETGRRA